MFFNTDNLNMLREKTATFKGESLQPVGAIPANGKVVIKLVSEHQCLEIRYGKNIKVTLPYDRIINFVLMPQKVDVNRDDLNVAGGILSAGLGGKAGMFAGNLISNIKLKQTNWVGNLTYQTKNGELENLYFIQLENDNYYKNEAKSPVGSKFEKAVNEIASRFGKTVTEL